MANIDQQRKYKETEKVIETEMENAEQTIKQSLDDLENAKKFKAEQQGKTI